MELTVAEAKRAGELLSWQRGQGAAQPCNTVGVNLLWNSAAFGARCVLAICFAADDSLEFAGLCAKLFGRLTDEQGRLASGDPGQESADDRSSDEPSRVPLRKAA